VDVAVIVAVDVIGPVDVVALVNGNEIVDVAVVAGTEATPARSSR
jgi:hypothetical protein